ncbi:MAG: lamin tail domain-containing protein [Ginsengibacter sp.]
MKNILLVGLLLLTSFYIKAQDPQRYDVVIDELFPDPLPSVGLPASEFIELKNISGTAYNLTAWKLSNGSSTANIPSFVLQPDSFVIVCSKSAAPLFPATAIGVNNFPSLNNDGDILFLLSPQNRVVHAVHYSSKWYGNELKKEGGWTLEMIDCKNPCSGQSNWKASINAKGGTPGFENSVASVNPDNIAPQLMHAFAADSANIILEFSEPLDSIQGATALNYSLSDGIGSPAEATAVPPVFDHVNLHLNSSIPANKVYTVTATNVGDCKGNKITAHNAARFGLPSPADTFDVVINEILFHPDAGGVDYVELYNRSQKIFDISHFYLANRNNTGVISSIVKLKDERRLFFPGDFILLTENTGIVQQEYISGDPGVFEQLDKMPSFPNDKGDVIVLNEQGNIVDEVKYNDKWHFQLISNTEGVALERIDYNAPSSQNNFHSAATSAGYGTPGTKNSQHKIDQQFTGQVSINPEIFSPDNDGFDDFLTIEYNFPATGYVANISIFDVNGRPVRYLQRNALSGTKGSYRWDGLGEKQQQLPQGIYIVFTEIFNAAGNKSQFKNTVVLARK